MAKFKNIAALVGALALVCAVVGYQWYANFGKRGAPPPLAAVTAAPLPSASASAVPTPVVYVVTQPVQAGNDPPPQPSGEGSATVAQPTSVPLAGTSTTIPELPSKAGGSTYVAPSPPIIVASEAAPEIVSMSISTPVVRSGQTVFGSVETSTNVASVEARIGGYSSNLRKVGAGRFRLDYRVPFVPFFMKKTYTVQIIARNTRGDAVSTTFPVTVR
jgi:hypothetical protein